MIRNEATERQVQAADPQQSTWLSANAGSGKTRVLTDRVARLLLEEVEPQHILCLTYTKAAASEMQNRLFKRLGTWAMLPEADLAAALAEAGELGPVAPLVMVHRFVDRGAGELRERWLEVQFDSTLTNDRLRDLGLPVWPLERPATLVWVAVERDGQRDLLGLADSDGALLDLMVEDAAVVGGPLLLPLMDLQDQQLASVSDGWGGFADQLRPASERYGARQLLLGRSYLSGGTWTTRWLLSGMARRQRWETRGTTLESTLSAGMGRLAAAMAAEAASRPEEFSGRLLRIRVHGVSSARGYGTVMLYLTGRSVVDRLEPVSVFGEYLDLNLSSNVGLRGFQQALQDQSERAHAAVAGSLYRPFPDHAVVR